MRGKAYLPCISRYGRPGGRKWNSRFYCSRDGRKMTKPPYLESRKWLRTEIQKANFDVAGGDPPWCGFLRCNSNHQLGHLRWWESLRNMISQNLSPEISDYELTIPRASDGPSAGCVCRIWRTRRVGADHEWLAAATFLGFFLSCEISLLGV